MRRRVAQIVMCTGACLFADESHVRAQSTACPPSSASASDDKGSSGPRISITEVTFSGFPQIPIPDRDRIADSIKQKEYGNSLDGLIDDAGGRVKARGNDRGYFTVRATGKEARLASSPTSPRMAL